MTIKETWPVWISALIFGVWILTMVGCGSDTPTQQYYYQNNNYRSLWCYDQYRGWHLNRWNVYEYCQPIAP